MNCSYCFYEDVSNHRQIKDYGMMKIETMHYLIHQALLFVDEGMIHFAFQGGEPTLIGLDFFEQFVEYVNKNKKEQIITYSIQTNGTTLNDLWIQFFKKNEFLVGVSIDGTASHHDNYRRYHSNKGTHQDIINNVEKLSSLGVETNVLSVLNNELVKHIEETYSFFKSKHLHFMQFIPQLNDIDHSSSNQDLDNQHYLYFLRTLFKLWVDDILSGKLNSIRYFDNMLLIYLGYEPESCDLKGVCSIQNIIEADGSIYPCDFYVLDSYKLGNITINSFQEAHHTMTAKSFLDESLIRNDECYQCPWFKLCRSGCKRRRDLSHKDKYCDVYKKFFSETDLQFRELALKIENGFIIKPE